MRRSKSKRIKKELVKKTQRELVSTWRDLFSMTRGKGLCICSNSVFYFIKCPIHGEMWNIDNIEGRIKYLREVVNK